MTDRVDACVGEAAGAGGGLLVGCRGGGGGGEEGMVACRWDFWAVEGLRKGKWSMLGGLGVREWGSGWFERLLVFVLGLERRFPILWLHIRLGISECPLVHVFVLFLPYLPLPD